MRTFTQLRSTLSTRVLKAGKYLSALVLILSAFSINAQVDCDITMACNDGIQVSLDENCEAQIYPDMILEDPAYDNEFYTVIVMDQQGNIIPDALMDYSHVNQLFDVSVQLNGCPVSCWGNMTIEDKLAPQFIDCLDVEVECDADLTPGVDVPQVSAFDACSVVIDYDYSDVVTNNPCDSAYAQTVERTWTVTDEQGNSAMCTQTINVLRATLSDVVFPPNYDDIDQPAFSCSVNIETLPNGAPSPNVTGFPTGADCPNIQTYYSDIIFDICGASIKVLRQWVVIDWCTGEELNYNQIIKILDNQPPVCTTNPDFIDQIFTDEGECTATYEVPAPIVIFECSEYSYTVGYKLKDENGDPFDQPIYDNVTYNPFTELYSISDLPQDTTWIVYTVTDACGNSSQCFTEVFVQDGEAPTPVCEGYTVVSLEDAGWADLYATSVDDGSFDNCEIDRLEIKRFSTPCGFPSDLQFGEKVNFCCEDVDAGYIQVAMRAYDKAGNFNDCIVNVNVQDKINPTIECPDNITINCETDYTNTDITGYPEAFDNCSVEITYTDNANLNDCGLGTVVRTWRATDAQGRFAQCIQIITVADFDPFNESDIVWPGDLEINDCSKDNATPEILNSFPQLSNTDCANIAVSYDDDIFYNVPDYCIKVLRHWKVIDWCSYDPQDPVYYEYTQKIAIYNTIAPVFETCQDVEILSEDGACEETITLEVNATDDCTPSALIKYTYSIDEDNDGIVDFTGITNSITLTLSSGTHKVTWTAEDKCGNITTCTKFVNIIDNKPPTPICIGQVTWVLDEDGFAEIWASDFNLKSEDSCDDEEELTYSFNEAGNMPAMTFTCADVPNGIAEEIPLRMYVFDTDGNFEYCEVSLILQDSDLTNACDDMENAGRIAGHIYTETNEGIESIDVELMDMSISEAEMGETHEAGDYLFEEVPYYNGYTIEPYKNDDVTNGVSTLDLVLIQRHILGLAELDSPYKLIAADVNASDNLTSTDLLDLRKVILGIHSEFSSNTSWRFMPSSFEIEDPEHPYDFPEKVLISEMYLSDENIDFTAIKIGDVNNSANVSNGEKSSTRSASKLLKWDNQPLTVGEQIEIPVYANELNNLTGLQLAIGTDQSKAVIRGITSGALQIDASMTNMKNNAIALSWFNATPIEVNTNEVLFYVQVEVIATDMLENVLHIDPKAMDAEVYDAELATFGLDIEIGEGVYEHQKTVLYQNTPNPFKGMTTIAFELEDKQDATLTIYDVSGKQLYTMTREFNRGYNELTIDTESMDTQSGVLFYQLQSGNFIQSKKMMIIR